LEATAGAGIEAAFDVAEMRSLSESRDVIDRRDDGDFKRVNPSVISS